MCGNPSSLLHHCQENSPLFFRHFQLPSESLWGNTQSTTFAFPVTSGESSVLILACGSQEYWSQCALLDTLSNKVERSQTSAGTTPPLHVKIPNSSFFPLYNCGSPESSILTAVAIPQFLRAASCSWDLSKRLLAPPCNVNSELPIQYWFIYVPKIPQHIGLLWRGVTSFCLPVYITEFVQAEPFCFFFQKIRYEMYVSLLKEGGGKELLSPNDNDGSGLKKCHSSPSLNQESPVSAKVKRNVSERKDYRPETPSIKQKVT